MSGEAPGEGIRIGFLEAVAAAALWGSSGIFAVRLFQAGIPPTSVAILRMALGTLFLTAWALAFRRADLSLPPRAVAVLLLVGGAPVAAFQVVYQISIDSVGVPSTVALLYLAPVFVLAASVPLLGERPTKRRVALAFAVVLGVWLAVFGAEEVQALYVGRSLVWGVLTAICYAGYTLFGRFATVRWGTVPMVVYSSLGATIFLSASLPMLADGLVLPRTAGVWGLLIAFALLTITLASLLFFDALRRLEASRVAVAAATEPLVAALLATLLLGQGLHPAGWLGVGIVAAGVAAVGASESRPT